MSASQESLRGDTQKYREWLEQRKSGIGGSDAAAVLGLNPYKTNVQLWEEKVGLREIEDISHKPYVQYGLQAEEHLRALFALDYPQYSVSHEEYEIIRHSEYPFLFATLDGKLVEYETGRKGFLEVKTANILTSRHREKWDNRIPDNYYTQCLHYFFVTEAEFCVLKAHLITEYGEDKRTVTRHYFMERRDVEEDIEYLKEKEIAFWKDYVLPKKQPPLILPAL